MSFRSALLHAADRITGTFGLPTPRLVAEELVEEVRRQCAWPDASGDLCLEPLRRLLLSYNEEADLSLFGRIAARWNIRCYLANRLRFQKEEEKDPGILQQPVEAPLFITGLPRSGTTFLHSLLALDPATRVPRCWQTIYPYPHRPGAWTFRDSRQRDVERKLRTFAKVAPGFKSFHPIDADSPQECTEITAHSFASLRFDTTHHVPSYRRWLDQVGHLESYRLHRLFLQHLQHQVGRGRWVLKSPDHVFALDAIRAVYPDARLIFVHRDPVRVLGSVARLTSILREPFARRVDRLQVGRQVGSHWAQGVRHMIGEKMTPRFPDRQVVHVHYLRLTKQPLETVADIYRRFDLELPPDVAARIRQAVAAKPKGGYGRNVYRLEDFGLDAAEERERHHRYMREFDVEPEGLP